MDVIKYEPSAFFFGISATPVWAFALSLLSCVHSLGLGLDLGNSLDQRGESAHTLIHKSQRIKKKGSC